MAITIQIQPADLEQLRFAVSPLVELMFSYALLHKPTHPNYRLHQRWVENANQNIAGLEFPYLSSLVPMKHYTADFVTPTPTKEHMDIETELQRVLATPPQIVRKNVEYIIEISGETEIRRQFLAYPSETLACLTEELRLYWKRALAPHWSRIQTVLENDILYRARQQALQGAEEMVNGLGDDLRYRSRTLEILKHHAASQLCFYMETLEGNGIRLVPTVFKASMISWQTAPEWQPMIIYGARGAGLWYSTEQPEPEGALRAAFGDARALLLQALLNPAHTSELAQRLGVTSGAISQQLTKLNDAGLVESHRSGYHVYYRLSPRGEQLMALFAG
ncbi:MAG: winged helix-turn-helix transcriptional regulator [Anaerolineae bacterium]|nr:winged helix-turn-helix transcriptional regulator [Anaerolineae bacterium]